jgi:very-short-patch-repair endonuclease
LNFMSLIYNLQQQKEFRKKLRRESSISEKIFWRAVRGKKLNCKFRRQFGIGKYIADFYCHELKLAVEIDGATHETAEELKNDSEKEKYLDGLGIKTKRYKNVDVKNNLDGVIEDLIDVIKSLRNTTPSGSPL